NLMKLALPAMDGLSQVMMIEAQEIAEETAAMLSQYQSQMEEVNAALDREFGNTEVVLDPLQVGNALNQVVESPERFLSRTTMVGTDIVDMSLAMISDFATMNTQTQLPI